MANLNSYTSLPANAFGPNPGQFAAIKNGANQNSLANQLFAGKPPAPKPIAAATSVKSPNAPTNTGTAALLTSALPKSITPQSSTPSPVASGLSINSSGAALTPPTNQEIASHTVTDSQGNTITQKYVPTTSSSSTNSPKTPSSESSPAVTDSLMQYPVTPVPGTFSGLVNKTIGAAEGNAPIGQAAADIAANYGKQIADVNKTFSNAAAGDLSTGTQAVGGGNANIEYNTASNRIQGLSAAESAALQGTGQQLTAQNQQQAGLLGAAGAAKPTAEAYGQTVFNPLTGQYDNGGGLPSETMAQYAQMAASGQYAAIPTSITSNPVLSAQLNEAAKKINPSFSPITSTAQGNATAANTVTGNTASVQANQGVYEKAYGDYKNLENAVSNVDQFGTLLVNNMGGINPTDARYANKTISQIRGQLSSAQQAQFDTTLAALTSKVSGLLSVGGNEIPTDISAAANKIIDGSLPVGSLTSVLNRIKDEGNILLTNQANLVNSAYKGTQGGQSNITQNANTNQITWDSLIQ